MPVGFAAALAMMLASPALPLRYAVAVLDVGWVHARPDGIGTGWIVDRKRKLLVTCRHVVGEQKKVEVFFPASRDGTLVSEKSAYLGNREELRKVGRLIDGTVVQKSDAADLALVRLDALPPHAHGLPLAEGPPPPGEPLFSIGNRGSLDTLWNLTVGPVRQTGKLADGYPWRGAKLARGADSLLLQLPIEEGDSGGPILDRSGRVVAVVSAIRTRAPLATVGVDVAEVRKLLDSQGKVGAPPPQPAGKPPEPRKKPETIYNSLAPSTVWIHPTSTESRVAGVLVDRRHVVTSHAGVGPVSRVAVLFPIARDGRILGERDAYADPVGMRLRGVWRIGTVVGRDPIRDLAILRLDDVPADAKPVPLAGTEPSVGDSVHAISHPTGLEFAWCYSRGVVRQRGKMHVGPAREDDPTPLANLFQLPTQGTSPGGPIVNDRGELVGVLAVREGVQQQAAYAATLAELREFLAGQPRRDVERTVRGLRESLRIPHIAALLWAMEAERLRIAGKLAAAEKACDTALSLDPACVPALVSRGEVWLTAGQTDDAAADFDRALAADPASRPAAWGRSAIAMRRNQPRKAVAELAKLLDPDPADADTQRLLASALVAAGEDAKADRAFSNAVRLDPRQFPKIAADLLTAVEESLQKAPDATGRVADALSRGLTAAIAALPTGAARTRLVESLHRANRAVDEKARLAALREIARNPPK